MRIGIDPQMFLLQEYGGISRYYCNLALELSRQSGITVRIIAPLHINAHLAQLPPELGGGWKAPRIPKTGRVLRAAGRLLARPAMRRFHPDIVHETYYSPEAYAPPGARRVVTVVDMIHERFPDAFEKNDPTAAWKRLVTQRADHVICISASTRRDLLERIDLPEKKVTVVHLGFDLPAAVAPAANASAKPYLLYVGQRAGYKNFTGFLRAFSNSPWLRGNFSVVCFGGAFTRDENRLLAELGLGNGQVVQRGGGDEKLADSYRAAAAFIYPSLYEGFGIPLLESMSQDCPVVCGNTSSLPEVAGEAAEYFDPRDADSMCAALERVLNSPARREELIRLGRARAAQFSWTRCAAETRAIYDGLMP